MKFYDTHRPKSAVILDASLGSATEVVLRPLCVRKRVVAMPYPDFIYIFGCVLISIVSCTAA